MSDYYVMHRIGRFEVEKSAENQCKAPGWPAYEYQLKMVFDGNMTLDTDGFIVEHQDIDDLVQGLKMTGSCELLVRKIVDRVTKMCGYKALPLLAIRGLIRPIGMQVSAWFEYAHADDAHLHTLMML